MKDAAFTFGLHKGRLVCEVTTSYLSWASANMHALTGTVMNAVRAELKHRSHEGKPSKGYADRTEAENRRQEKRNLEAAKLERGGSSAVEAIKAFKREVWMSYHPDRGNGGEEGIAAAKVAASIMAILESKLKLHGVEL